jgi:hypothetical protein
VRVHAEDFREPLAPALDGLGALEQSRRCLRV